MNNTIKKAAAVFAAAMTILSTSAASAFASTTDIGWEGVTNRIRSKDNTSSVYVYNQSYKDGTVSVYGYKNGYNYSVSSCSGYRNTYKTTNVTIPARSRREVHQFVKEKGYPSVHIYFNTDKTYGVWSSDTAGSYTSAN